MSNNPHRGMNSAHSRTASSSRSFPSELNREDVTVINSTALPRNISYSKAERTSSDSVNSSLKNSKQPGTQPSANDPFRSIARAIQNVKIRSGARLSVLATKQRYARSSARYRYAYATAKTITKIVFVILMLLITASLIFESKSKEQTGSTPHFSSWLQILKWRKLTWFSSRSRDSISLREALIHRPHQMTTKNFEKGPWVIALITDLDKESCRAQDGIDSEIREVSCGKANTWVSYLKRGVLRMTKRLVSKKLQVGTSSEFEVEWLDETELSGHGHYEVGRKQHGGGGGRGMELSELEWFFGHLLTPDDHTGMLLEIMSPRGLLDSRTDDYFNGESSNVKPSTFHRATLLDGAGIDSSAVFKSEWMAVKDGELIIGGHGRSYTDPTDGTRIRNDNPKWVKVVNRDFAVRHVNWSSSYDTISRAAGVVFPAYLMHEAVLWSAERREWVFLPRRRSMEPFDSEANERKGWNAAVIASEDFNKVTVVTIKGLEDSSGYRGFSSAKFIPGTRDSIVAAVRTLEKDSSLSSPSGRETASFLSIFELSTGKVLLDEQKFDSKKFEGLAIL